MTKYGTPTYNEHVSAAQEYITRLSKCYPQYKESLTFRKSVNQIFMRDKLYGIFYPEANLFDEFLEILIKGAEGLYVFEAFHGGVTAFAYELAKVVETLQEGSGYVYVIKNGFTYKIGITQNMKKRMQSYRKTESAFPYKIVFCHRVAKYKEVEKLLHRKFEHQKIGTGREWFKLSDDDLSKIEKTLMLYSVQ